MNFEELFIIAIYTLIERNGGSLESSLDDLKITNKELRKEIKDFLEWEE